MKRIIVIVPLLLLLLTSCVREVSLDAGGQPAVVVECILRNSGTQELRLNFTKGSSEPEAVPLTDAVATLHDLTGEHTAGRFERRGGDLWTLEYTPVAGHTYRLEVEVPGYDLIYAEDTMPRDIELATGREVYFGGFILSNQYDQEEVMDALKDKYPDRTGELCFLRGSFYHIEDVSHPFLVYGMNYNDATGEYEMVESICTDHPSVLSCTLSGGSYVPPCIIEELPNVQLYPLLDGAPLHRRYMMFPAGCDKDEDFFIISGDFAGKWWNEGYYPDDDAVRGYLMFVSMSDHYSLYLEDALLRHSLRESSDMTAIYIRDNIHTNVNGGIGLFAGISERKTEWEMRYTNLDAWERFWYGYEQNPEDYYDRDGRIRHMNDRDDRTIYDLFKSGRLTDYLYYLIG